MKPSEVKALLLKTIAKKYPVMIKGIPGIGKTELVKQIAAELGQDLIIMHPVIMEPPDTRGFPFIDRDTKNASFIPFDNLKALINASKPTICLIDDLGTANKNVQAALMQLVLARQISDHKVSDHVTFIACTNDVTHNSGVSGILEALKSRFLTIIEMFADLEDWKLWAIKNDIEPRVIGFLNLRPELLSAFKPTNSLTNTPSPRGNESVSNILKLEIEDKNLEFEAIAGAAGEGYAIEFNTFNELYEQLESYDMIIKHPALVAIPRENPSIIQAYCAMIAYKAKKEHMRSILTFAERLGKEFEVKFIEYDLKTAKPEIMETKEYIEWAINNQIIFKAA